MNAADELEIRNVIARLALLADMGDLDEYASLFTEDAEWNMPGGPKNGRADIHAGAVDRRAAGGVGPGTNTRHVVGTVAVKAVDDDTATAEAYFQFYVDSATAPALRLFGHYDDTFRRTPDGWKLARRQITFG
jgi:uncharacterized protein (TIGR02246 family)